MPGRLEAIHVTESAGAPMRALERATLHAGVGIEGDALIGREFLVGSVRCRGERRCEPCAYLEGLIGRPILRDFAHRGGLRATILAGGEIAVGDAIEAL